MCLFSRKNKIYEDDYSPILNHEPMEEKMCLFSRKTEMYVDDYNPILDHEIKEEKICLFSKKTKMHEDDYNPIFDYEPTTKKYSKLELSKYFNISLCFQSNSTTQQHREQQVSHIFYRNYFEEIPENFYHL